MSLEEAKQAAGVYAAQLIAPGMRVGLGTGSTANCFIDALAMRKLDIICVTTSKMSHERAYRHGLRLATLDEVLELDITVDGADEIGPNLSLIKGGGAALLYEKIVATASKQMVVIADESKCVPVLGKFPLPIEVVPFGLAATKRLILEACRELGLNGELAVRQLAGGEKLITEAGHFIIDAHLKAIPKPEALAERLAAIPGVVEHGLFLNIAARAIIAGKNGVREFTAQSFKPAA